MATKFNTIFRSKDVQEVQELEKEGAKAISLQIDDPSKFHEWSESGGVMVVGEQRLELEPHALEKPEVQELTQALLQWLNDTLEGRRIVVRDIVEDIYDGQILGELLSELTKEEVNVVPVTQSAYMQRNKLKYLMEKIDRLLGVEEKVRAKKWTVQTVHSKDVVAILRLLVALARHFRCPYSLPRNVSIRRILLKQLEKKLDSSILVEEITGDDIGPTAPLQKSMAKDVFDKLFEEAPEKLEPVKRSLCQFCSRVLQEMDVTIVDIETQFTNGVNLVLMLGILEGFFIPFSQWHYTPKNHEQRLDNVKLVFKLLEDIGLPQERSKPEEIVYKDLKSTLRVLYAIFGKYKSRFQQQQPQQTTPTHSTPASDV